MGLNIEDEESSSGEQISMNFVIFNPFPQLKVVAVTGTCGGVPQLLTLGRRRPAVEQRLLPSSANVTAVSGIFAASLEGLEG